MAIKNSIVEHVYNPHEQFKPRVHHRSHGGDTLSLPGRPGEKAWTKQRNHMYTEDPKAFREERILMQVRPGQDARERVQNTTDPLYCLHAQITVKFQNKIYGGSGALVGPHHLLTCAHNIFKQKKKMWATDITVCPALNGKQEPFGEVKVTKVYTFVQYTQNHDSNYDLALLILEKSIGKYTGWAGLLSAPTNTLSQLEVNIHGYPGDKNFTEMWGMKHTIQQIHPEQFEYLIDTHGGQSGSAIWINQFGQPIIVGVHIAGGAHSNFGVRISKDKFEILVSKIEETYRRQKIAAPNPQPAYPTTQPSPKIQPTPVPTSVVPKQPINPQPPIQPALPPMAFGKARWAQYFGDVGVEPPLPPNIHEILDAPCPIWPGKRVHETHLLTLIPQTINGQPLTLQKLGELVQKPLQGPATKYSSFNLGNYSDQPTPRSHWTLLSRDVIPNSRSKNYAAQQQVAAAYGGYEIPNVLDTAVILFMEHVQSGNRLYEGMYTRCQEKYNANRQLAVGGFAAGGLDVRSCIDGEGGVVGVVLSRKFF